MKSVPTEELQGFSLISSSTEVSQSASAVPSWREFGTDLSDLELDLSSGSRPALVTRILMNCIEIDNIES